MVRKSAIFVLSFGAVVINTMPLWIGALGRYQDVSDGLAGAFGSLVLLSAAATCAGLGGTRLRDASRFLLTPSFALLGLANAFPSILLGACCTVLGASLGCLTRQALQDLSSGPNAVKAISVAVSLGLAVSLGIYVLVPSLSIPPLVLLAVLSLPVAVMPLAVLRKDAVSRASSAVLSIPVGYLGFFVMMGAYWTFLDLFGARFGDADAVNLWLLASLISGMAGSLVATAIPLGWRAHIQRAGIALASVTGAASYASSDLAVFGFTIVANGFALFLFFPLYLKGAGQQMPQAMAGYLLGFATGGVAGAALVEVGGYAVLSAAILLFGVVALVFTSRQPRPE